MRRYGTEQKRMGGASREEIIDLHNAVESLEEPYRTIIKTEIF